MIWAKAEQEQAGQAWVYQSIAPARCAHFARLCKNLAWA